MLLRFDPFRELDRAASGARAGFPMDAYRHGDEVVVHLDLPGVDPSSLDLSVHRRVLTISAERPAPAAEGAEVLVRERPRGRVQRRLVLAEALDTERIEARYEHGVLTLTIPLAQSAKPRRIEVSTGASQEQAEVPSAA